MNLQRGILSAEQKSLNQMVLTHSIGYIGKRLMSFQLFIILFTSFYIFTLSAVV